MMNIKILSTTKIPRKKSPGKYIQLQKWLSNKIMKYIIIQLQKNNHWQVLRILEKNYISYKYYTNINVLIFFP